VYLQGILSFLGAKLYFIHKNLVGELLILGMCKRIFISITDRFWLIALEADSAGVRVSGHSDFTDGAEERSNFWCIFDFHNIYSGIIHV